MDGLPKVPNGVVALLCVLIAGVGVILQIVAVRFVYRVGTKGLSWHD